MSELVLFDSARASAPQILFYECPSVPKGVFTSKRSRENRDEQSVKHHVVIFDRGFRQHADAACHIP